MHECDFQCFKTVSVRSSVFIPEGEYAFTRRKAIVPLLLQPRYKADGWLGALITNKLYFDLSIEEKIQDSMAKLVKELGNRGKGKLQPKSYSHIKLKFYFLYKSTY